MLQFVHYLISHFSISINPKKNEWRTVIDMLVQLINNCCTIERVQILEDMLNNIGDQRKRALANNLTIPICLEGERKSSSNRTTEPDLQRSCVRC